MNKNLTTMCKACIRYIRDEIKIPVAEEMLKRLANELYQNVRTDKKYNYAGEQKVKALCFLMYELCIPEITKNKEAVNEYVRLQVLKSLLSEYSNIEGADNLYDSLCKKESVIKLTYNISTKDIKESLDRFNEGKTPVNEKDPIDYTEYNYILNKWIYWYAKDPIGFEESLKH